MHTIAILAAPIYPFWVAIMSSAEQPRAEKALGTQTTSLCHLLPHTECCRQGPPRHFHLCISHTLLRGVEVLVLLSVWFQIPSVGSLSLMQWKSWFTEISRSPTHTPPTPILLNYTRTVSFLSKLHPQHPVQYLPQNSIGWTGFNWMTCMSCWGRGKKPAVSYFYNC